MATLYAEEPLANVAYCHDGSLEGFFSAVFETYLRHEEPSDITAAGLLQPRLGQSLRYIETDEVAASRVRKGIIRAGGQATFRIVVKAFLADHPQKDSYLYVFIAKLMRLEREDKKAAQEMLDNLTDSAVDPVIKLARSVDQECEKMRQFLRFQHTNDGIWFAKINPKANVVPLIMGHFQARMGNAAFLIYDENHNIAGISAGRGWRLVQTDSVDLPQLSEDEEQMQKAWKHFYDSLTITERYHPELRQSFMPQRLWKNITEIQDEIVPSKPRLNQSRE
ncbi:MAG: TIGR03915 family putative DNA repair protein [Eggerthellaceae bacterium]|jgi:probable DNA metabolism protein